MRAIGTLTTAAASSTSGRIRRPISSCVWFIGVVRARACSLQDHLMGCRRRAKRTGYIGAAMPGAAAAMELRAGMAASTSCRRSAIRIETSSGTQASRAP